MVTIERRQNSLHSYGQDEVDAGDYHEETEAEESGGRYAEQENGDDCKAVEYHKQYYLQWNPQ